MVYAIFQGEYSDWQVVGYFDNEQDAYDFCAINNDGQYRYDQYYVEAINKIEADFEKPTLYYIYRLYTKYNSTELELEIEASLTPEPPHISIDGSRWCVDFTSAKWLDRDQAAKIAQDKLAQYKAEQAGL